MINRVVLVGRLTKDPELRYTSSNIPVSKFTLAVNRTFTGPSGEREADFIQCVVWRKQAENLVKFVRKGSLIGVEGRIQTGSYDDKDGIRKYTTEVIGDSVQFLEPKSAVQDKSSFNDNSRQDYPQNNNYQNNNNTKKESTPTIDVAEDDLPF
jgi:single-strand DNA-binding protein